MGMWSRSYSNHTGSNVNTTKDQGGGSKKAGFPYMVGRMASGLGHVDPQPLKKWNTTIMPLARISRPVGSLSSGNRSYWNIK